MLTKILTIYSNSKGTYGSPKIKKMLERNNVFIYIRTVNNYMRILGIQSIVLKSYHKNQMSRLTEEEKYLIVNLIKI